MGTAEHIFPEIQGAFLVALKSGSYRPGVRTRSFPSSSSLMEGMPPIYQQSMRGTCVASTVTALVEYYEDCKARLSVQFLHEMTKSVERSWIDENLQSLSKGGSVDAEFGTRFSNQVAQIRLTSNVNGAESPAAQALLNAFDRQIKSHFGIQSGSSIRHCFAAIKEYGVCRYSLWPYANIQTEEGSNCASLPPGSKEDAQKHRILTGLYILRSPNNVDEIRGILAGANNRRPMPVCVGLELYERCDGETFTFPDVYESEGRYVSGNAMKGVHEMLIVGYEDDVKAPGGGWFTVRNSWGTDWGRNGYGRVPYAYVECFCVEAGTILQDMVDYAGDGYGGMTSGVSSSTDGGRFSRARLLCGIAAIIVFGAVMVGFLRWQNNKISNNVVQFEEHSAPSDVEAAKLPALEKIKTEEEKTNVERDVSDEAEIAIKADAERKAEEIAETAVKEKARREAELKKIEAEKKALEIERARLAQEKLFAEERARLEKERREVERAKRLDEERRLAAERERLEFVAKLEAQRKAKEKLEREEQAKRMAEEKRHAAESAEKARLAAEELKKPIDFVFHMTINCTDEKERKTLLAAMSNVTQETGFRLSNIRSEGKASMWGSSRLSVRCDMTVSAPRNRCPDARKMLAEYLAEECKTEDSVDWGHASRIMCVQDFSSQAEARKIQHNEKFGFQS